MKTVIMPTELTAENGAKGAMMGEFCEELEIHCPDCEVDEPDEECDICHGNYFYTDKVHISWTTIKNIYRMAVKVCGKPVGADG